MLKRLVRDLAQALDRPARQIEAAWHDAYAVQREFEQRLRDEGAKAMDRGPRQRASSCWSSSGGRTTSTTAG